MLTALHSVFIQSIGHTHSRQDFQLKLTPCSEVLDTAGLSHRFRAIPRRPQAKDGDDTSHGSMAASSHILAYSLFSNRLATQRYIS
jgi:hypothetical protein